MDTKELSDVLRKEWNKRRRSSNSNEVFEMLVSAYSEEHRHYHNLQHVSEMLDILPNCSNALYMAVCFHDAAYDPKLKDNEEKSAELAEKCCLSFGYAPEFGKEVASLIMATTHKKVPETEEGKLMADADLSIFAYDRIMDYEAGIRKEYSFYTDEAYYPVRVWVLESFLARPFIYHTEKFREEYEEKARGNLKVLIGELENKLSDLDTCTVNFAPSD